MTCVLALDIAMGRTGWAVAADDWAKPVWGVFETVRWRDDREGENLVMWEERLETLFNDYPISHVITERIFVDVRIHGLHKVIAVLRQKGINRAIKMLNELLASPSFDFKASQAQFMLQGAVLKLARKRKVAVMEATTDNWREDFLGHNRRPKDHLGETDYWKDIALAVAAELGCYCTYHDEAEAIGILVYALRTLDRSYKAKTTGFHNKQILDQMFGRGAYA